MTVPDPLGPVVIGAREIYDAVVRVGNAVERLTDQHADTERALADHETRLRAVEDARPGPRLNDLSARVRAVEASRWPLPSVAILASLAAVGVAVWSRVG